MTTAMVGNGSVPVTRMEALASELRLLKSGMADMQGRLDALLSEIGTELQGVSAENEILPGRQDDEVQPQEIAEISAEPAIAEIEQEPAAVSDTALDLEPAAIEPAAIEIAQVKAIADEPVLVESIGEPAIEAAVAIDAEAIEQTADVALAEVAAIEAATESVAAETVEVAAEMAAETVATAPVAEIVQTIEAPAAEAALPANVVVLADRRPAPRKGRSVAVKAGRWAAAVALVAIGLTAVAVGSGFAGFGMDFAEHRELVMSPEQFCALAGETCSIYLSIP